MPSYLQRIHGDTRTAVTPCWLHEEDAVKAAADLEGLRVVTNDFWAGNAIFGKIGFHNAGAREKFADWHWQDAVEREIARYYELCGPETRLK